MGNRKKLKDNRLRLKKNPGVLQRGLAKAFGPDERDVPTHDEAFTAVGKGPFTEQELIAMQLDSPESEVIKVVPAKHKGVIVGDAHIFDDGQVAIKFSKDAPQWALDEIRDSANHIGYDLETGAPSDGSS